MKERLRDLFHCQGGVLADDFLAGVKKPAQAGFFNGREQVTVGLLLKLVEVSLRAILDHRLSLAKAFHQAFVFRAHMVRQDLSEA